MPRIRIRLSVDYAPGDNAIWSGHNVAGRIVVTSTRKVRAIKVFATMRSIVKTKVRIGNNFVRQENVIYHRKSDNLVEGEDAVSLGSQPRRFPFSLPTSLELPSTVDFKRTGRALVEHVIDVVVISLQPKLLGGEKKTTSRARYAFYLHRSFPSSFPPSLQLQEVQCGVRTGLIMKRVDLGTWNIAAHRPPIMIACEDNPMAITIDMTQATADASVDRVKACAAVVARVNSTAEGILYQAEWTVAACDFPPLLWDLDTKTLTGQCTLRLDDRHGMEIKKSHRHALQLPSNVDMISDSINTFTLQVRYFLIIGVTYAGVLRAKSEAEVQLWRYRQDGVYVGDDGEGRDQLLAMQLEAPPNGAVVSVTRPSAPMADEDIRAMMADGAADATLPSYVDSLDAPVPEVAPPPAWTPA
eukprot:TRINITY_DN7541_c0_g2_i1.p1 TRINITY_DN7541_c0_g2~~TRINITY_DN7541_c0_g2_i1.p1  ORF type:complete len:413 (+),score=62.70 TRINITY_DN7541_c0_g2_i1:73-1311(+)